MGARTLESKEKKNMRQYEIALRLHAIAMRSYYNCIINHAVAIIIAAISISVRSH